MKKPTEIILKIVFFLIIGFFVYQLFIEKESMDSRIAKIEVANGDNKKDSSNPIVELKKKAMDNIASMEAKGYIAFEIESNKVYVKPSIWEVMDYKMKENMTAAFAMYCAMKKGNSLVRIDVYDKQSGKKIAEYSGLWGCKVL